MRVKYMIATVGLVALCCVFLLTAGCSKELTRGKALELIRQSAKYPQPVHFWFKSSYELGPIDPKTTSDYQKSEFEDGLEKSGLVKIVSEKVTRKGIGFFPGMETYLRINYELTEKGKKLLVIDEKHRGGLFDSGGTFLRGTVGEQDIKEVTGITPDPLAPQTRQIAEYTVIDTNPTVLLKLSNLLKDKDQTRFQEGALTTRQAAFTLYDDGWRCTASK